MSSTGRNNLVHSNKKMSTASLPTRGVSVISPQGVFSIRTSANSSIKYASGSKMSSRQTIKSKSLRLSDLMAAMYPGVKVGHKHCVEKTVFVPKTMGWLWNTEDTATGVPFPRGWRPGAIAMDARKKALRQRLLSVPQSTPTGSKGKRMKKKPKTDSSGKLKSSISDTSSLVVDIPPTLCIQKEHGVYHVKMRPIKKPDQDESVEEEQPVQFKIADSVSSRSQISNSTSSTLKIEYMCTGALRKPIKKPELAEMGTQWETSDFEMKKSVKIEDTDEKIHKKGKKKKVSGQVQPEPS